VTITPASLRAIMPEFSDLVAYPDAAINFWLADAYTILNPQRWAASLDKGAMLYTAHMIVMGKRRADAANRGGTPGQVKGPISSQGVGPASVSYDTGSVIEKDAGFYNSTDYGTQFYNLMMLAGMGGAYVSGAIQQGFATGLTNTGLFPNI
jgi:hypothetical protein